MVLPEGESGPTDDSNYHLPGLCTIHTEPATTAPETQETQETPEPIETEPFVPKSPLDQIYIPRGPGYQ